VLLSTAECVNMSLTPADYNKQLKVNFSLPVCCASYMTERSLPRLSAVPSFIRIAELYFGLGAASRSGRCNNDLMQPLAWRVCRQD
jgi:hypothetical protein